MTRSVDTSAFTGSVDIQEGGWRVLRVGNELRFGVPQGTTLIYR